MTDKKKKTLLILLAVLAGISLLTLIVSKIEVHKEKIRTSDEIILELSPDDITALSWDTPENTISLTKNEEGIWHWDEDESFPVDEEAVSDMLELFESFGVAFEIDDVTDKNTYGLKNPTATITATTADESYTLNVGSFSTMDEQRYVCFGDEDKVYLVSTDPYNTINVSIADLILNDEIPDVTDASAVKFDGTESYSIEKDETGKNSICEDDIWFKGNLPLDTSEVKAYLKAVKNISFTDYVTYNATDDELASYGMNNPDETVTVTYLDEDETEQTFTFSLSQNPEELAEAQEKEADEDEDPLEDVTAYIRIGDSKIVYRISRDTYNTLMDCAYNDLRHNEVLTASSEQIATMEISLEGTDTILTQTIKKDESTWTKGEGDEAEEVEGSDIVSSLLAICVESFENQTPGDKCEIAVKVTLNDDEATAIKINFYRVDGDHCLAVVDGSSLGLVPRSDVVDLIEQVQKVVLA